MFFFATATLIGSGVAIASDIVIGFSSGIASASVCAGDIEFVFDIDVWCCCV